jgi:hypothetical protein
MKNYSFKAHNHFLKTSLTGLILLAAAVFFSGCSDDDPKKEDTPELITKATLTFTPAGGGSAIVVTATDPDGEGVQNMAPDDEIDLAANTEYVLTLQLTNGLAEPSDEAYDVTAEVSEERDEHMFFFGWTNNLFSNPAGNGNVDNRSDAVNYDDEDSNNLPLGLTTTWTSTDATASGTFSILLKHQPDLKSATSDSNTGETDLDITFTINVQ